MRLLAFTTLLLCGLLRAQGVVEVYYCVPPDQGCDGYCALDLPAWNACSNGGAYNLEPFGCADFDPYYTDGDTLFIGICTDPCTITIADGLGGVCICSLTSLIPTGMEERTSALSVSGNGGAIVLRSKNALEEPMLTMFDATGRRVMRARLMTGSQWEFPVDDQAPGLHLIVLETALERLVARF